MLLTGEQDQRSWTDYRLDRVRSGCQTQGRRRRENISGTLLRAEKEHVAEAGKGQGDPQPIARALRHADGPVTIIAGERVARDDARTELERLRGVLRARVAAVPDAKDVAGIPGFGSSSALGVTGVMGHPGVAAALADSALCLLVGTRMSVTARTGPDEALASVPVFSIGSAPPYVACTHVHADDLRGSLSLLTQALTGPGRARSVRVPDVLPHTELHPPPYDGPGVRYPEAMMVLDATVPDGVDVVVDAGNSGRPRFITCRCAAVAAL